MKIQQLLLLAALIPAFSIASTTMTDAQVKRKIIEQSIDDYPGNCPCPYNTDRAGRSCGKRSAYTKPGGYAPLCYAKDVTKSMVEEWKQQHQK
jgi:hypothetical protein